MEIKKKKNGNVLRIEREVIQMYFSLVPTPALQQLASIVQINIGTTEDKNVKRGLPDASFQRSPSIVVESRGRRETEELSNSA